MAKKFSKAENVWLPNISRVREAHGSGMLVFITAITVGIVLSLIFFGLNYVRLVGSGGEQKKAIEAAALAAANDLSRIVINTDQFGYVSISDAAPVGTTTAAGDNYYLQVRSINTLMGTARLEKMLAKAVAPADAYDTLNYLADQDYANTKKVATQLEAILTAAITSGGSGTDINGVVVTPYADALAAYQDNAQRISAQSTYVPNSLTLTLGQVTQPLATNIAVPVSALFPGDVPASSQINNKFISNIDIPFNGNDYVFMAIGSTSALLDPKAFVPTLPGLPFQYPSIVEAQAQQIVTQTNNQNSGGAQISSAACAEPASIYDPLPAPGAMSFSFPDGMVLEITSPNIVLTDPQLNSTTLPANSSDIATPVGGDYPADRLAGAAMTPIPWLVPPVAPAPAIGSLYRVALFDWFRRAGTKAQLDSVLANLAAPFSPAFPTTQIEWIGDTSTTPPTTTPLDVGMKIPQGITFIYKFNKDGTVNCTNKVIKPYPFASESQNQLYADSYTAFVSADPAFPITSPTITLPSLKGKKSVAGTVVLTNNWDVFVRDECRTPGLNLGGKHAGEPLCNAIVAMVPGDDKHLCWSDHGGSGSGAKPKGGGGGGSIPLLSEEDAWSLQMYPYEPANGAGSVFTVYPAGSGVRPTYQTNGTAFDLRFRRELDCSDLAKVLGFDQGYVADELP